MKPFLLIVVPLVGAALAALWPGNRTRPWFLPVIGEWLRLRDRMDRVMA